MSKNVSIAGMGWLGLPLARHLQKLGYSIKGSVSSLDKATLLQKSGLEVYRIEVSEAGVNGEVDAFFDNTDTLIIMIPPGLRRDTGANHVLKMTNLLKLIEQSSLTQMILVSSSSVYDDIQGIVTEKDQPQPQTEAAKQLFQVENLYFNSKLKTSIVRFGGLIGGNRQPVRYLAGRKDLSLGNAPVNLIHREDCIGILLEILKQEAYGYIFNAVNPMHPSKKVYYNQKAIELDLIPPQFSVEDLGVYKQIDSENVSSVLGYTFTHEL